MVYSLRVSFPSPSFLRVVAGFFVYIVHSENTYVNHINLKFSLNEYGITCLGQISGKILQFLDFFYNGFHFTQKLN